MQRKPVPEEQAARILRAVEALEAARVERDQAMTDALKAGSSLREVAAAAGMSVSQTQKIGHANGWPTPAQKKKWDDEKAERDRFAAYVDLYRQQRADDPNT